MPTTNNQQLTTSIGIIGAGAMGAGIAQVAATAGHTVLVYDTNQTALDKAKVSLESTLKKLVEKQKLTAKAVTPTPAEKCKRYFYTNTI